ncbi:MAG: SDR family oxidoreductase [Eggerthellaceae bacterium]
MRGSDHTIFETGQMGIPRFDLTDKVAIITGVGSEIGIGRGIARTFAAYGAKLVVADMHNDNIQARAKEIAAEFDAEVIPVRCDVRCEEDRESLVRTAMDAFGRIDILVNNAGVTLTNDQLAMDVDEEEWDRVVDTDYKAVFFLTQRVAKIMIEQERGNIINIASVVARVASTRMLPYSSAKAAVVQMTRCMAFEWARFNIRANCICPGYIDTNMTQSTLNKPKAYEAITRPIPHNRKVGDPMDIAAAALFLASDCSDMVNGTPLYVDGARSIW